MPNYIPQPLFGISFGSFPIYAVMLFIAFIAGVILFKKTFKKKFFSKCVNKRIKRSFFWSGIFAVLGSNIITNMMYDDTMHLPVIQRFTQGRFSFYFALLSFLITATILLRINKINLKFALNKIVSPILIVQFFSRLGCSLAGCCYGKSLEIFGASIPLPVRETEALFALVLLIALHKRVFDKHLKIYLFSYSLFRFITDFFRGDDRGSLFGIEFLSPTQIVAFFVIFISGIWLFARPFFKLIRQEKALDDFKAKVKSCFDGSKSKKGPYTPVPFNYVEPKGTKHPLRVIIALLLVFSIIFLSFVYINPMNFEWFEDIRDSISYTLFKKKTPQNNIGSLNGSSVLRFYDQSPIASDDEALEFAKSYDQWKDFRFSKAKTKKLSNGNSVYIFQQEFNGKPVIGRNRVLVTDKDNKPLYLAGDEASLSLTNEIRPSFTSTSPTVQEAFGDGILFIEKTECWYDTGSGLVDAYHAVLSKDGTTAVAGAVLQKSDEKLICLTDPETKCPIDSSVTDVLVAGNSVCTMLESNDTDTIKEMGKTDISSVPATETGFATIEKALCSAFSKLDVTAEQYRSIIESAAEIATLIPSLSANLYSEILCEEARATILNNGGAVSAAEDAAEVIAKAFSKCGIKAEDDEAVSSITADTRKSTYKQTINFAEDVDAFNLTTQANHTTSVTLTTESPVMLEIYDISGRAVVTMYVEEEETITLYPEDGTDFDFRVSDYSGESLITSPADYKIVLESEEVKIPEQIESTLSRIESAYNNSLAPIFSTMYLEKDLGLSMEESFAITLLAPIVDSIASDCGGMGDSVDSAKTYMACALTGSLLDAEQFAFLKGTDIELSYISHAYTENYTALKAKLVISMGDMTIYEGYSFMRLEDVEYDLSMIPQDQRAIVDLISGFLDDGYCITDVNETYLYELFGDTAGTVSPTSDIASLYDLWYDEVKIIGGLYPVTLKHIDTEKALMEGHSPEKLEGFEEYTVRYNLAQLKSMRVGIQGAYEIFSSIATLGNPAKKFIDGVSDPLGYFADELFAQHEVTNFLWVAISVIRNPVGEATDYVTDSVLDIIFDACGDTALIQLAILGEFDKVIAEYESQLT